MFTNLFLNNKRKYPLESNILSQNLSIEKYKINICTFSIHEVKVSMYV
jgi:hypothetical protein